MLSLFRGLTTCSANSRGMVRKNAKGIIKPSNNYRLPKHSESRIDKRSLTGSLKNVLKESMRKYFITTFDKAPRLFDFYVPSEEQKNGELVHCRILSSRGIRRPQIRRFTRM